MTVSELIEQLKNYPADMRILTLGYEGGYDDIKLETEPVVFDVNSKDTWYLGRHEHINMFPDSPEIKANGKTCVIIGRSC